MATMDFLDELYDVIASRKKNGGEESYTAKLFEKGTEKIAQKVGEEAVEAVIAAMKKDSKELISESADLLFHLLVLWADQGVKPKDIIEKLKERKGVSGIEEKKNRKK